MHKRFSRFLLIWAAILLFIGLVGCIVLFRFLGSYEKSRPEPIMEDLISSMSAADFIRSAKQNCTFAVSEFEDAAALYDSYVSGFDAEIGKLSYRKEPGNSDRKHASFSIRSGSCNIAQVILVPDSSKPVGFGRHEWTLDSIGSGDLSKSIDGYDAFVFAPEDETVLINGNIADRSYISNEKTLNIPALIKYENADSLPVRYVRYDIGRIYGDMSVSGETGGEASVSHSEGGNSIYYFISPETTYSVSITAPEDVSVYINGVAVPLEEAKRKNDLFEGLEEYTNGFEYGNAVYDISGFVGMPVVTAKDASGTDLIPFSSGEGRYTFLHANEPSAQAEHSITAEDFFRVYKAYATAAYNPETMGKLLNRTLRHSELFDYFLNSQDAYIWTPSITTEYEAQTIDNFSMVGDNCFVCSVDYQIKQTAKTRTGTDVYNLDHAFELVFVKSNDAWFCTKMEAITD